MDFDEFKVRCQFLSQMPTGYRIRSCSMIDGHYVYEAYSKDESPKDVTVEPFYLVNRDGSVENLLTVKNLEKLHSAKTIWCDKKWI